MRHLLHLILLSFASVNVATAAPPERCYRVFLHELGFDAKQRHVELSFENAEGNHVFFNPYNSRVDVEAGDVLASSNSDLVFTISMNESEFKTFQDLIEARRKARTGDWCTLGACKILNQSTGMFLPAPVTFFPRTLVYHLLMMRALNPSRVVGVKFVGSKVIYFLIRQMSLGGILEMGAIGYGAYKLHQTHSKKVDQYEIELEDPSGKRSKHLIEVDSENEYKVHY
jgi:hypothetical protein